MNTANYIVPFIFFLQTCVLRRLRSGLTEDVIAANCERRNNTVIFATGVCNPAEGDQLQPFIIQPEYNYW
jgi:hypothetical protein